MVQQKEPCSLKYPDLQSPRHPIVHYDEIPLPIFGELPYISDEDTSIFKGYEEEDEEVVFEDDAPYPFSQKELNDLVRDLSLSKDSAELLASRLKKISLRVLATASSATGINNTSVFSIKKRTWCTVQVLRSFCSSLGCHSTKPKIGDY